MENPPQISYKTEDLFTLKPDIIQQESTVKSALLTVSGHIEPIGTYIKPNKKPMISHIWLVIGSVFAIGMITILIQKKRKKNSILYQ